LLIEGAPEIISWDIFVHSYYKFQMNKLENDVPLTCG
jgi:hypothetical protein